MIDLSGRKVKTVHIHAGVDLIGSKTSMAASRNVNLTITNQGVLMESKATRREVVIPFANIKGYELFPVELSAEPTEPVAEASAPAKRGRPPKTV